MSFKPVGFLKYFKTERFELADSFCTFYPHRKILPRSYPFSSEISIDPYDCSLSRVSYFWVFKCIVILIKLLKLHVYNRQNNIQVHAILNFLGFFRATKKNHYTCHIVYISTDTRNLCWLVNQLYISFQLKLKCQHCFSGTYTLLNCIVL